MINLVMRIEVILWDNVTDIVRDDIDEQLVREGGDTLEQILHPLADDVIG